MGDPQTNQDIIFGTLVVKRNLASNQQVGRCLKEVKRRRKQGEDITLADIMVSNGLLEPGVAKELLHFQQNNLISCPKCNAFYNIENIVGKKKIKCKKCQEIIPIASTRRKESGEASASSELKQRVPRQDLISFVKARKRKQRAAQTSAALEESASSGENDDEDGTIAFSVEAVKKETEGALGKEAVAAKESTEDEGKATLAFSSAVEEDSGEEDATTYYDLGASGGSEKEKGMETLEDSLAVDTSRQEGESRKGISPLQLETEGIETIEVEEEEEFSSAQGKEEVGEEAVVSKAKIRPSIGRLTSSSREAGQSFEGGEGAELEFSAGVQEVEEEEEELEVSLPPAEDLTSSSAERREVEEAEERELAVSSSEEEGAPAKVKLELDVKTTTAPLSPGLAMFRRTSSEEDLDKAEERETSSEVSLEVEEEEVAVPEKVEKELASEQLVQRGEELRLEMSAHLEALESKADLSEGGKGEEDVREKEGVEAAALEVEAGQEEEAEAERELELELEEDISSPLEEEAASFREEEEKVSEVFEGEREVLQSAEEGEGSSALPESEEEDDSLPSEEPTEKEVLLGQEASSLKVEEEAERPVASEEEGLEPAPVVGKEEAPEVEEAIGSVDREKAGALGEQRSKVEPAPVVSVPDAEEISQAFYSHWRRLQRETRAKWRKLAATPRFYLLSYFSKMYPERSYPLYLRIELQVPSFLQGFLKNPPLLGKSDPAFKVVPVFPDCLVTPGYVEVSTTAREAFARFWITPLGDSALGEAEIQIYYQGQLVDEIPLPAKVRTQDWSKVFLTGAFFFAALPFLFPLLDPIFVQWLTQKLQSLSLWSLLEPWGGLWAASFALSAIFGVFSLLAFWYCRQKRQERKGSFFLQAPEFSSGKGAVVMGQEREGFVDGGELETQPDSPLKVSSPEVEEEGNSEFNLGPMEKSGVISSRDKPPLTSIQESVSPAVEEKVSEKKSVQCGADLDRFLEVVRSGQAASVIAATDNLTLSYSVSSDGRFVKRVIALGEGAPLEFLGEEMYVEFTPGDFKAEWVRGLRDGIEDFEGPLKDLIREKWL